MLLNSTHSCSRHGVVAARPTSERPGSVIPLSKNIHCTGSAFIAAVIVDVCETDRKRLAARAQCLSGLLAGIVMTVPRISGQFGHCYTGCGDNSQATLHNVVLMLTAARGAIRFIDRYSGKQRAQEAEPTFTSIAVCYISNL